MLSFFFQCSFCGKKIEIGKEKKISLSSSIDGKTAIYLIKHEECGPIKRCNNRQCKQIQETKFSFFSFDEHGALPIDIYIGIDYSKKRPVFLNYCSVECQKKR